jgi:hypothetical protein
MRLACFSAVPFRAGVLAICTVLAAASCSGDDVPGNPDGSLVDGAVIDAPEPIPDAADIDAAGPVCGDEFCQAGETCETCEDDCGACPVTCGDDVCEEPIEDCDSCPDDCECGPCNDICEPFSDCDFCPTDCDPDVCGISFCGDGFCDIDFGECDFCPEDCEGVCGSCGDGTCTFDEDCSSCPDDCTDGCVCGDDVCDPGECSDLGSCPGDCPDGCLCDHDICLDGPPLDESCDPCVATICATFSWCCDEVWGWWDTTCIIAVGDMCGIECPTVCGDFICDEVGSPPGTEGESCETCETDCGTCPTCGDGWCQETGGFGLSEDCAKCPADCGFCPSDCGDGLCDGSETCTTCSLDCGACTCGDGDCEFPAETCSSCSDDCGVCFCGDGVCAIGENCLSCALDCECLPCTHSVCEVGEALDVMCEECTEIVCASSPWCCEPFGGFWDGFCVEQAQFVCGKDCGIVGVCGDDLCDVSEDCWECAADCSCT